MRIYLAGPMRGYPNWNHAAFDHATEILRSEGHEVFSPAEEDRKMFPEGVPKDLPIRKILKKDINWILDHAEVVALLPRWKRSRGARFEAAGAVAAGIPTWELPARYDRNPEP